MSYVGWVKYRRGIMEHVLDRRLTGLQHYALSQLILMADASKGGYNVNAPILCYWCGYAFNLDTAEKILKALHEKRYIWYRGLRGSKHPQPYWVNKYTITAGPFAVRMTNLSQFFNKSTISQEDVFQCADQHTDHGTDQHTDHDTDNYKNEELRKEKKDKTYSSPIGNDAKNDARNDAKNDARNDAQRDAKRSTKGRAMTHDDASDANAANDARRDAYRDAAERRRLKLIPGAEPFYADADTGEPVDWSTARHEIEIGAVIEVNQ